MKYKIINPIQGGFELFDTQEEAENRINPLKQKIISEESYRFSVAKIVVNGNDTTWMSADLENDSEEGTYQVFNHLTGLHEEVQTLTAAKARYQELKDEFFVPLSTLNVVEVEDPVVVGLIPKTVIS